jgi:hypothetical protein
VIADPPLRPLLERLARLLLGYGITGLVVAAIGRVNGLADRLHGDVGGVSATLERTATVLDTAAATASGFGTTVDSSTIALNQAAADVRAIVPQLRDIETRANDINLLGSRPLEPIAGLFGQIADQLGNLDVQLDGVATNLTANRAALTANATSLADLAAQTRTLSQRLAGDSLPAAVDDARWLLVAMLAIGTLGAVVPASGALLLGTWLRRWLRRPGGALT